MLRIAGFPHRFGVGSATDRRCDPQVWWVDVQTGVQNMSKRQVRELSYLFDDGVPFYLAKELVGLENSEQEFDASYTWRRWTTELEEWGFYSW
jgi:hypothetical protein